MTAKKEPFEDDKPFISGLNENFTVQKSKPLFSLWRNGLTLKQFKIIDTYLSRINSRDRKRKTVIFKAGEFEELCGAKRLRKDELIKTVQSLQVPVLIETNGDIKSIVLFSSAECKADKTGTWTVKLSASPEAMTYIFDLEKIGYFRYKLRNILHIVSRHSYILFTYLESMRDNHHGTDTVTEWTVAVDDLKMMLGCTDMQTYEGFKYFNNQVLQKCHKELNEKTEIRFEYEPEKSGKFVTGVHFILQPINIEEAAEITATDTETETDRDPTQTTLNDYEQPGQQTTQDSEQPKEKHRYKYSSKFLDELAEAVNYEFDDEQMQILNLCMPKFDNFGVNERERAKFEYLMKMYLSLGKQSEKNARNGKPIKDRFKYLKRMIEKDQKDTEK